MASLIKVLSEAVANRIAAGEVVERPASVVKELIENALDAGARRLEIDLEEGGVRLVRVQDDGLGMGSDDLERCILSHATSKIGDVGDLFRIASFGFRGEALPSIASVSETMILSRRPEDDIGARLLCKGGETEGPIPAGGPVGTTVEVRHLFFNVPARRKFMKRERTELSHCLETVTRLLLPEPDVAVRVNHNRKKVLEIGPDADLRGRVRTFFGKKIAAALLHVRGGGGDLRLEALVGPPSLVRTTSRQQYLFLNGRFIKDRSLVFAAKDAYRGLIMPKDHPVLFLLIDIDPAAVDVNVHPTKTEVRFRDKDRVFALVRAAIRTELLA
ncbi:MAG: DNA mismatch repair protein MutL, partial [Planctomycetes bacterium]|nr:DNA mismatch repair protein MutL [Planctomycetota bacterium]